MIKATVNQLQADKRQVEVIRLRTVDPQLAMLSIEKLFGIGEALEEGEKPNPNMPRVDADPITRSLLIRGSQPQIDDIRKLLVKMGEQDTDGESGDRSLTSGRGNLRMIPIDAATARRALEQMNTIWPTVRKNEIRTVRPSRPIRGLREAISPDTTSPSPREIRGERSVREKVEPAPNETDGRTVSESTTSKYIQLEVPEETDASGEVATSTSGPLPAVIVTIGDQGLLIASEDLEALDEFEDIFMTLADRLFTGSREMAIFYLRFAKSDVASEMLKQFISGGSSSSGGGTTLLGSLAGAALGNSGIGSMLGLGGGAGGSSSARISSGTTIISDPRLNAVIVQATPKELDFIEQLLKILDTSKSPERIETVPRPRAIPVVNTDAESVAEIVRSVYATRLAGGASASANRQPSPEEFMRALSGQKNPSKSINNSIQDQVRVNISVDTRRNALLVVAPDSLFEEIKELVADLDFATPELAQTVQYGQVKGSSPEMIRAAIATMMGDEQEMARKDSSSKQNKASGGNGSNQKGQQQPGFEEMRRRVEFFRSIQNRAAKDKASAAKKAAGKRGK